jgi:VIT1/CCC1 family predicted Fe2+/Mn2+ transporter
MLAVDPRNEMSATSDLDRAFHDRIDPHRTGSRLGEVILGGQDGLVNVLGVILGVAAASGSPRLVLAAGLAAAFAESISMAAVAYTTRRAEADRYASERARELRHVRRVPAIERAEIRELYRRKGFEGELLERIVDVLTSDENVWVTVMMEEEHHLAPGRLRHALVSSLVVGVAAIAGSLIPLVPFLVLPVRAGTWASLVLAAVVLFLFGGYKARRTTGRFWASGLELAVIGVASAFAGYVIGLLFQ